MIHLISGRESSVGVRVREVHLLHCMVSVLESSHSGKTSNKHGICCGGRMQCAHICVSAHGAQSVYSIFFSIQYITEFTCLYSNGFTLYHMRARQSGSVRTENKIKMNNDSFQSEVCMCRRLKTTQTWNIYMVVQMICS